MPFLEERTTHRSEALRVARPEAVGLARTKEVLGGYALLSAASKEEAVEHTRRFLGHVGQGTCEGTREGTCETYQLFEMPTGEGQ